MAWHQNITWTNDDPIQWCIYASPCLTALHWRHNERDGISNHQPHDCLFNVLFRCRSKKTSKLRVTGHCAGNSPVTGEFPAQKASNAENVSIWWHHGEGNMNEQTNEVMGNNIFQVFSSLLPGNTIWCQWTRDTFGSANGLSPVWRPDIIWTNAELLPNRPVRTNFNEIWTNIQFSYKNRHLKVASVKWRLFLSSPNGLNPVWPYYQA